MFRTLALTLCLSVLLPCAVRGRQPDGASPTPLAARVDGSIEITVAEVDDMVRAMLRGQQMPEDELAATRRRIRPQAIDQLVTQKLLLRAAEQGGVTVADSEIEAYFRERLPPGVTIDQVAQQEGMSVARIRADVATSLRINKFMETKVAGVPAPTEAEIKAVFDELSAQRPDFVETGARVEARHILLKVEPGTPDEERLKIREQLAGIRKEIVDGKVDFAAMAAKHSHCPSGKNGGGSLGTFGRGQMVKPFEDAAFAQEPNVVGEIVETDFGFHIVEVLQKFPAGKRTIESERVRLEQMARRRKQGERAGDYVRELKAAARVEILEAPAPEAPAPESPRELPAWAQ